MALPPAGDKSEEGDGDGGGGVRKKAQAPGGPRGDGAAHPGEVGNKAQATVDLGGGGVAHAGAEESKQAQATMGLGGGGGAGECDAGAKAGSSEGADDEYVLSRLKALCCVLGSNYREKLDEAGLISGAEMTTAVRERIIETVKSLEKTKEERFKMIKDSAKELVNLWFRSEQPTRRLIKMYQLFYAHNAKSADQIHDEKYLSAALLRNIKKEIESIKASNLKLVKDKYQKKRKKLIQLLKELHLVPAEVGFNPKEKIDPEGYPLKIEELRKLIRKLKKGRGSRLSLVLKMEMIEAGRKDKLSADKLKFLIAVAKKFVENNQTDGDIWYYNGENVFDVLKAAEEMVMSTEADRTENNTTHTSTTENNTSSRSMRLATRLKKKGASCTVQKAATASLNFPRKSRSGPSDKTSSASAEVRHPDADAE